MGSVLRKDALVLKRKQEKWKATWRGMRGWKWNVVDQKAVVLLSQRHPHRLFATTTTHRRPPVPIVENTFSSAKTSTTTPERRARPCNSFLPPLSAVTRHKHGLRTAFSSCSATAKSSAAPIRTRSSHPPHLSRLQRPKSKVIRGIQQRRPRLPELWFGTWRSYRGHSQ